MSGDSKGKGREVHEVNLSKKVANCCKEGRVTLATGHTVNNR